MYKRLLSVNNRSLSQTPLHKFATQRATPRAHSCALLQSRSSSVEERLRERDTKQDFHRHWLVIHQGGMENPLLQRSSDGVAHTRVRGALYGNSGDLSVFADSRVNHDLMLRVLLGNRGRKLWPFAASNSRRNDLLRPSICDTVILDDGILHGPCRIVEIRRGLYRQINGEDALVIENAEIFESTAAARGGNDRQVVRALRLDGECGLVFRVCLL